MNSETSETSKHLNGLNTVYDRTFVQKTNMATPAYEKTLPELEVSIRVGRSQL
jgi:hypothetical protein